MLKQKQGTLFVVSGPSGVGKTTVVTKFLQQYGCHYDVERVVTYTTKQPRVTEEHGVDYHFIHQSEFERKIQDNFFLEWSGEYGACYGTPSSIIDKVKEGKSYILVIDRLGARQIMEKHPDAVLIWIHISSLDELSRRLCGRKTESEEVIQSRLFLAKKEIAEEAENPMYHYHIINDSLYSAVKGFSDVVLPRVFYLHKDIK